MTRLRQETAEAHRSVEQTRLARAMLDGTLSPERFAAWLDCLGALLIPTESAMFDSTDPQVMAVRSPSMRRAHWLRADRSALGVEWPVPPSWAALRARIELQLATLEPAQLLGVIYVLEGSSLGSLVVHAHLLRYDFLSAEMRRYHRGHGTATRELWRALAMRMNVALERPGWTEQAVVSARWAFASLEALLEQSLLQRSQPLFEDTNPGHGESATSA